MEQNTTQLGILHFGISLTLLEEVFIKVGADYGQEEQLNALEKENKNGTLPTTIVIDPTAVETDFNRHTSETKC